MDQGSEVSVSREIARRLFRRYPLGAVLLPILLACNQKPGQPLTLDSRAATAITDSVTSLLEAWRTSVQSLDTASLANFYLNDTTFRWIEDGRIRFTSPTELLSAWGSTAAGVREMNLILDQTQVTPLAQGVALVTTSFVQRVTDTAGRQGGFAGATTLVAVDTPEGWRFLLGHTSAAGGPAARPEPF